MISGERSPWNFSVVSVATHVKTFWFPPATVWVPEYKELHGKCEVSTWKQVMEDWTHNSAPSRLLVLTTP